MTAQEFLNQTFVINSEINRKQQHIEALRNLLVSSTPALTGMPKNPSPNNSRMADIVAEIADLEKEVEADIERLVQIRHDIVEAAFLLKAETERAIIEDRYVKFMRWEEIVTHLGYSKSHVLRIHNDAVNHIVLPLKNGTK